MPTNHSNDIPDLRQVRDRFKKSRYYTIEQRFFDAHKDQSQLSELLIDAKCFDDYYRLNTALLCSEEVDRMSKMFRSLFDYQFTIDEPTDQVSIRFEKGLPPFILNPLSILRGQLVADVQPYKTNSEGDTYLVFNVTDVPEAINHQYIKLSPAQEYPQSTMQRLSKLIIQRAYLIPPFEMFDRCRDALQKIRDDDNHFLGRVLTALLSSDSESILKDYENNKPLIDFDETDNSELKQTMNALDDDQRKAIMDILSAKFRPYPYVVIGIPGSGKTRILIEAIHQVFKRSNGSRKILVCASRESNLRRLYDRVVSGPLSGSWIGEHNIDTRNFDNYRVTSRLSSEKSDKPIYFATTLKSASFNDNYFDYIFLDNASSTHQPETLIVWHKLKSDGCFVLCGDRHQEYTDFQNRATGDVPSMLELFSFTALPVQYDKRRITYLSRSYRCDPRIISWTISEHYGHEIDGNEAPVDNMLTGILRRPVVLVDAKSPNGSRLYQRVDQLVTICTRYMRHLGEIGIGADDIGVIAITKRVYLRDSLRRSLQRRYNDCMVDTVEELQGVEKKAIVVILDPFRKEDRTDVKYIYGGKRRLTMAMSRARQFAIIIGDFDFLRTANLWTKIRASAQWVNESISIQLKAGLSIRRR